MPGLKVGYELIDDFLSDNQLNSINSELMDVSFPDKAGGIRNAEKKYSSIRNIAASDELMAYVNKYLSGDASLVRAILFNKTSENNWLVTWHQDRTVTVSEKIEENGWGPWSIKDEVLHVQPPVSVLEQMVTFRIHLDDTCLENGCLKVLPNSHKLGILDPCAIKKYTQSHEAVACEAPAGSALVMRPHILHSSSKAIFPTQRRVLHLEYSSFKLPLGVSWA
ncbi:phytanoyl-CoA dioxygenase family protein [Saccharophagus degradans]|uniref:Phytanoyl-CoA dioxygenase n=1 Tax=Saccharophagus degradans (strain 2-40 / ATCC 43961 / DSM 17024) TaxID=203122 RepID=Q21PK1_SACD2|nr:phytanoyl-CoA dioxygenase family protein [Saccharophagus degradans]ABD79378.1 Phytanoyl-CoA dioxygenase [Saccharophagus degradans 2-40]